MGLPISDLPLPIVNRIKSERGTHNQIKAQPLTIYRAIGRPTPAGPYIGPLADISRAKPERLKMAQGPLEVEGPPDGDRRTLRGKRASLLDKIDRRRITRDRRSPRGSCLRPGDVSSGSTPDFFLGGRTSASAECRHWSGRQSVGQAAQFCFRSAVFQP